MRPQFENSHVMNKEAEAQRGMVICSVTQLLCGKSKAQTQIFLHLLKPKLFSLNLTASGPSCLRGDFTVTPHLTTSAHNDGYYLPGSLTRHSFTSFIFFTLSDSPPRFKIPVDRSSTFEYPREHHRCSQNIAHKY